MSKNKTRTTKTLTSQLKPPPPPKPAKKDYIIIHSINGEIKDVWKLKDRNITLEIGNEYVFKDGAGNTVDLKTNEGTIKIITVNDKIIWDLYHEYHSEFDNFTYSHYIKEEWKKFYDR